MVETLSSSGRLRLPTMMMMILNSKLKSTYLIHTRTRLFSTRDRHSLRRPLHCGSQNRRIIDVSSGELIATIVFLAQLMLSSKLLTNQHPVQILYRNENCLTSPNSTKYIIYSIPNATCECECTNMASKTILTLL